MKRPIAEARREVSRREILAAAKRCFASQGVRATSLAKLADELGVTKAALYYYFDSKQEIVIATVNQNVAEFRAEVLGDLPAGLTAAETIRARLEGKVARGERDGPLDLRFYYTVMLETLDEPEIERVIQDFIADGRAETEAIVRRGQESGEFRADAPVDTALTVLGAAVMGLDLLWLHSPATVDLRAGYELIIEQFLQALAPDVASLVPGDR